VSDALGVSLMRKALREQLLNLHLPLDPTPIVCYATVSDPVEREKEREPYIPVRKGRPNHETSGLVNRCPECRFEPREGFEQDEEWYKPHDIKPEVTNG